MSAGLRFMGGQTLASIAKTVAELADGTARRRAVGAMARELRSDVRAAFSSKRSPAGVAWADPVRPQAHPLLVKSGRLRSAALRVLLFGAGVRVVLPPYGKHQNDGAPRARLPARPFLPGDPMPPAVVERYARAILDALKPR